MASKINSLLLSLASLGLIAERNQIIRLASDSDQDLPDLTKDLEPVKRMPYEPDETAWAENAEEFGEDIEEETDQQLLEKAAPVPKQLFLDTYGLGIAASDFNKIVANSLARHGIRPIASEDWDDMLGSGSFGAVFRAVYDGKPAVVKISISGNSMSKDVDVWKRILSIWDSIPTQFKKHIQQVYLAYSETIQLTTGSIKLQVIVSEELRGLPEGVIRLISGADMPFEKIDDRLAEFVSRINKDICGPYKMAPVTVGSIRKLIQDGMVLDLANRNEKEIAKRKGKADGQNGNKPPSDFGTVRQASPVLISEVVKNYLITLAPTMKEKRAVVFGIPDIVCEVFKVALNGAERLPEHHNLPTAKTYSAPREVSMVYETIRWLDDHGISWGDLHAYNMMLGSDNNIKITDVGNFTIK